ncbi:MAG: pyrroline-5-carboxylate reductase [Actinobacteria bacterium]|nr:pyrroline-5-carboxylate reductase [Actinomycetota bacterium]
MRKIAFIGAGKMAEAILRELLRSGWVDAGGVVMSDVSEERLRKMEGEYGVGVTGSNTEAASGSEVVLLAVKPQNMEDVLKEIAGSLRQGQAVISIAMGRKTEFIEGLLPAGTEVVRAMPNNPAMVGEAVTVLSFGAYAGERTKELAREIFSSLGEVHEVEERLQDAAMALSGCGPAYFYVIAEALSDAGVKLGLGRDLSLMLAAGTMIGAGRMLRETGMHPGPLKDMVTSPGGSTIVALEALEEAGLRNAFYKALTAAWRRAQEV